MHKKTLISLIMLGFSFYQTPALAANDKVTLNKNYPEKYEVKKGDTLWGVSSKYLKKPEQWPKLWNMNKASVKNPHLIYPGDILIVDYSSGSLRLKKAKKGEIMLQPGIVVESMNEAAIPTISPAAIGPFLSQPLLIEGPTFKESGTVVASNRESVVISKGDLVYVTGQVNKPNVHWKFYREGKTLIDPVTKKVLGVEAVYLGDAKLVKSGYPATFEVTESNQEILINDKLVAMEYEPLNRFVPREPDQKINGNILSSYKGVDELGVGMILTLNRGTDHGLEQGHVLDVTQQATLVLDPTYQKTKDFKKGDDMVELPTENVGKVMVFRTYQNLSYGLLMQASKPIHVGDQVNSAE